MRKTFALTTVGLAVGGFVLSLLSQGCEKAAAQTTTSPDGRISVRVGTLDGRPFYTVHHDNEAVVDTSFIGLDMKECHIGKNAHIVDSHTTSVDETWEEPWGEESVVRNHYNATTYDFVEDGDSKIKFSVEFRVFDDGFGFRYIFPEQKALTNVTITDELSEFNLASDSKAWSIPWDTPYYEAVWKPSITSKLDTVCTPLTMKVSDKLYLTIHEAALTDYSKMNLAREATPSSTKFKTYLTPLSTGDKVVTSAPFNSPWRTMIIAEKPADLMLSRLMLNLNDPCAIEDVSWIEPTNYIGIWWGMHKKDYTWEMEGSDCHGATTENTRRYIDFAAEHGIGAVLVEGWNTGWAGDWSANGDKFSFTTAYPDYDLAGLADYAASKGVRLIAHNETGGHTLNYEAQLDSAYALYNKLGIKSIKTGYVNPRLDGKELNGSQYGVRHYRKVIETAAKYHIMVDNHEPVMPTGLQRTWPNLMTQEGVRGSEWDAFDSNGGNPAEHHVTLPFTRGLAGPMDYTPGIFNYENKHLPNTRPHATIAKQLATYLILYSPLQMAADKIENYVDRPEFEFLAKCPTSWDKTIIPEAAIGEYVTMARKARNSDDWYVASMCGRDTHSHNLSLSFLDPESSYTAKIFSDGEGADGETNPYPIKITEQQVNAQTVLPLNLARSGGVAIILTKN